VGERILRVDPLEAVLLKIERAEEWGAGGHRVNGGAGIVNEPGQGELGRAGGAPGGFHSLEDEDAQPGAGEQNGRGQAIGAGADDDRIMCAGSHHPQCYRNRKI
jgi:hypothetical protein